MHVNNKNKSQNLAFDHKTKSYDLVFSMVVFSYSLHPLLGDHHFQRENHNPDHNRKL